MRNKEMKNMMKGALLLSIASFIAKILSAVYRVPFQNMVGDVGFYVYQQVYPIYGIGMTFALSGFPVFLSKVVAESGDNGQLKKMLRDSVIILALFSGAIFLGLTVFAEQIAAAMGDVNLAPLISRVAWMFLLIPFLVVIRGYFQGKFQMMPTAISQIVEQLLRVGVILGTATLFLSKGFSVYEMGVLAMNGAWIGGAGALLVLLYYVFKYRKSVQPGVTEFGTGVIESHVEQSSHSFIHLLKRFFTEGAAICLFSAMLVLLQLVDSFTLYNGLLDFGMGEYTAKVAKGIYDRGQPLVQLGLVVGIGFTSGLLPMLTRYFTTNRQKEFVRTASTVLRITLAFSTVATVGMIVVLPYLNPLLFSDNQGSDVLAVYLLAVILSSLIMACNGVLQSQNQHRIGAVALLVGFALKWLLNILLVPMFGTMGSSVGTTIALLSILLLLLFNMQLEILRELAKGGFFKKLLFASGVMYGIVFAVLYLMTHYVIDSSGRTTDLLLTSVGVLVGIAVFIPLIIKIKLFTVREWLNVPFGKKILKKR